MTGNKEFGRHDLIETAMNRANPGVNSEGSRPTDPNAIWREEQARALKARHAQLEEARSEVERTREVRLVVPVQLEPASRSRSGRTLMLVVLGLMVLGAAVWWGATRPTGPLALDPPRAEVIQPVKVVVATPVVEAPASAPVVDLEALARSVVERWRQAWMQRDVDAYLASYAPSFVPPKGQTREQWQAARRDNLSSRASIEVVIGELRTEPVGDRQMAVYFLQDYISPTYQEKATPKTLLLEDIGGQWQIAGEWSGAFRAAADLKN